MWLYWDRLRRAKTPCVLVASTGVLEMYPLWHVDPNSADKKGKKEKKKKKANFIGKIYPSL